MTRMITLVISPAAQKPHERWRLYRFSWMKRGLRWTSSSIKGESPTVLKLWISPAFMTKVSPAHYSICSLEA